MVVGAAIGFVVCENRNIKTFIEASATPHVEASFLGYNFDVV
jgi:hypothetical protein